MKLSKDLQRIAQSELSKRYNLPLILDGQFGQRSSDALHHANFINPRWSVERRLIAFLQFVCQCQGITVVGAIDGYMGDSTKAGFSNLLDLHGIKTSSRWPKRDMSSMHAFYGEVGTNIVSIPTYPLKLAWDTTTIISRISAHKRCASEFRQGFKMVLDHYGMDEIKRLRLDHFGGSLNVRKKRGGTTWSEHAFACCFDMDPLNNRLRWGSDKATLAGPEYQPYHDIWKSLGAQNQGIMTGRDYMHTSFVEFN